MASPFRLFRKHVKPLLAVFVVMLMLSWVVGDSLLSYLTGARAGARGGGRRDAGAVAVTWDGGSLTNQQVSDLTMRRHILNTFLQRVEMEGRRKAYEAGVDPSQLRVQMLVGPDTPQQGVERNVVQTRLFADAARQAGMRVSDEAIVQYLDELGRGNVSRDQMREILNGMQSGGGRVPIDYVTAALREEMLASNYIASNKFALSTVTPEQRWNDWRRVNDYVVVEAAAIPAESFLVDVKEPTEAELQAFFDAYKNDDPGPDMRALQRYGVELPSPTPGFRIPRKVDLQFIEVNYDSFLAKAEEKVTDEEVAKYYEEHKDPMFIKPDTGLMEDKGEKKDADKPEGEAAKPPLGRELGAERQASDAKPSDAGVSPADGKAAEGQSPAPPSDPPPPLKEGKGDATTKDEKQSSLDVRPSKRVFRQVAFLQDAAKDDAAKDEAAKGDAAKDDKAKATDAAAKPAESTPAAGSAAAAAPVASPPPSVGPATPAAATTSPAPKKPPVFQPLDEVKDVIRRQLAEGKVAEQLTKLAKDIDDQLDADFTKYFDGKLTAEADKKAPPAPPKSLTDIAPLAEKYGLKSGATGPMSVLQMRDTPIGKSGLVDADNKRPLLSVLFGSRELDLYQPVSTVDLDGNHYVAMKKSDTPGRVPTLAEVRDEVVKAWKNQKAAELAEKRAEELAKKAQESKSPLTSFFADDSANSSIKVVRTDPFSELTVGDVGVANGQIQQSYRLSQPDGLIAPGPNLINRVFQLKDGEVAAVLNHDHSIAYVIRLVEHQPPLGERRTAYLAEANSWPGLGGMVQGHAQEVYANLAADLTTGANLKWQRAFDELPQEQSSSEDESSRGG